MMLRGFLVLIFVSLVSTQTMAFQAQDLKDLKQRVATHTESHYRQAFGDNIFEKNVEILVGSLDSRLRLAECSDKLTYKVIEPPHNAHNITVKTSCKGKQRWTVYIPATVNMYEDIVVANRSLARGELLMEDDLSYKRVNVASIGRGLVNDLDNVYGLELKRPVRAGELLRQNYLKKPDVVLKGQQVVLSTESRFLTVETTGTALVNGYVGERIKVKNEKSNRVIDAEVIAPGRVSVAIR